MIDTIVSTVWTKPALMRGSYFIIGLLALSCLRCWCHVFVVELAAAASVKCAQVSVIIITGDTITN